ncbi:50S ribosomal protein L34 [Streptomyces actuosus]|uniref:50S ribosomal protein L34 n=1 Tax=Streptomyces actuosus TaxID=1885 RepID=A0ABS2VTQ2_STRAS|nr:50S ribosomal protein L34 [Streptomyces actuosus]MBN0046511.1 50S ribosomal protein L34 [Streptomyces actuosus]
MRPNFRRRAGIHGYFLDSRTRTGRRAGQREKGRGSGHARA